MTGLSSLQVSMYLGLYVLIASVSPGAGYEVETHQAISQAATDQSTVGQALSESLGLVEGVRTIVNGRSLARWTNEGARLEDEGGFLSFRYRNHFHNPLGLWDEAGLRLPFPYFGVQIGKSSILWGQDPGQDWSWPSVRQYYLDALTSKLKGDRDRALAQTFRGLGQLIHLVQDAASPGHARNDPHVGTNYESAVLDLQIADEALFQELLSNPVAPDPGWQTLLGSELAPLPIARLLDTDLYDGTNPADTTSPLMGLAEYTQANFFSEDRIFAENSALRRFPYPARTSVSTIESDITLPSGEQVTRSYYQKVRDGDTGYRLATVGFLRDYFVRFNLDPARADQKPALDEIVYRDYASLLVPRAVGYSTALLNYFFRGKLYAFGDSTSVYFYNFSDEATDGTSTLYYDDKEGTRHPVPGASWTLTLGPQSFVNVSGFQPPTTPQPKDAEHYVLVFHGALGDEQEAVVARQVVLPSVVTVRLTGRLDGRPDQGFKVQTIEVEDQRILDSGVTDPDGKATLRWKPGGTVLLITNQNTPGGPMYWAGGSTFSSSSEGAKILEPSDVDAQGVLSVAIPRIIVRWPERVDPCTGNPVFQLGNGFNTSGRPIEGGHETVLSHWETKRATFTRNDTGQEVVLFDNFTFLAAIAPALVPEDLGRIGTVVGYLTRDVFSGHQRIQVDAGGTTTSYVCFNEYHEVEVLPVTIVEFNPFQ